MKNYGKLLRIVMFLWLGTVQSSSLQAQNFDFESWKSATLEKPYDVTFMVSNASCTENYGWQRNASDASANYNSHNAEFDSDIYNCINENAYADVMLVAHLPTDKYVTLCLPFSVNEKQTDQYFSDVKTITSLSQNGNEYQVATTDATQMKCGETYLVKARENRKGIFTFQGVYVQQQPSATINLGLKSLNGTYRHQLRLQGVYQTIGDGTTFRKTDEFCDVKAYSGYLM